MTWCKDMTIGERTDAVIASKRHGNIPHSPGKRLVGWIVDEELAGLSDGLFVMDEVEKRLNGVAQVQSKPVSFLEAMNIVERGFDTWKDKPHNAKWYSRIDGTPIPNDLKVNIAEAICYSTVSSTHSQTKIIEPIESVGLRGAQKQAIAEHASMLSSTEGK